MAADERWLVETEAREVAVEETKLFFFSFRPSLPLPGFLVYFYRQAGIVASLRASRWEDVQRTCRRADKDVLAPLSDTSDWWRRSR